MQEPESIRAYLQAVEDQIRWKRARPVLTRELARHLEDQRDAFIADGAQPEDAERHAVEDMGDPVALGAELDRVHRPRPQWGLLALTLALALAGAFLRVSLTAGWIDGIRGDRTLLAMILGTAALLGMYFLDISRLARRPRMIYLALLAAGIVSWYISPTFNAVPYYTRYIILTYPVAYALWLYSCWEKGWTGFLLAILGGVPPALIAAMTPYLMGLLLFLFTGLTLLLYAVWQNWFGVPRRAAAGCILALLLSVTGILAYLVAQGIGASRLENALHPELDPLGRGYQGVQIHRVLEASRWVGEGDLGPGVSFERFLPEAAYDMIPTTLIYHLGWMPYILLTALTLGLSAWLLLRGLRQKHRLGRLTVLAASLTLALQCLSSILLNTGFVLFSASYPLLSGNLHAITDMALIGLSLSVFRGDTIAREESAEPAPRLRRIKRIRLKIEYD